MSVSLNMHHVKSVEAQELGSASSLKINDREGNWVTVFMPYETAVAMAAAFTAAQAADDQDT